MDGRTVVRIFIEQDGRVTAEFRFKGMTQRDAALVNLRIDQIKRALIKATGEDDPLTEDDIADIDNLLDGGKNGI